VTARRSAHDVSFLEGELTRAAPLGEWRLRINALRATNLRAETVPRAFEWRGGEWSHPNGLYIAWTGRLLSIDNERVLDDAKVGERIAEGYLRWSLEL
jgi:hypothetical protein